MAKFKMHTNVTVKANAVISKVMDINDAFKYLEKEKIRGIKTIDSFVEEENKIRATLWEYAEFLRKDMDDVKEAFRQTTSLDDMLASDISGHGRSFGGSGNGTFGGGYGGGFRFR